MKKKTNSLIFNLGYTSSLAAAILSEHKFSDSFYFVMKKK